MKRRTAVALVVGLAVLATGCLQPIGSLDPAGPVNDTARAVNDLGTIVGESRLASGVTHAFVRTDTGAMVDLTPAEARRSAAAAINRYGIVAGSIGGPSGGAPFVWWYFTGLDVLPTPGGAVGAAALDINDQGTVLVRGYRDPNGETWDTFLWNPRDRTYSAPLARVVPYGLATGLALDDGDRVVGWATMLAEGRHRFRAAIWDSPGSVRLLAPGDGDHTAARDINRAGVIVGTSNRNTGSQTAVWWPSPDAAPVPLPGMAANTVNDAGQAVGATAAANGAGRTATLWELSTGRTVGLGDHGFGSEALGIDGSGRSVGWAIASEDPKAQAAVFWDPPDPPGPPDPG